MSSIFKGGLLGGGSKKEKTTVINQAGSVPITYSDPRSFGVYQGGVAKLGITPGRLSMPFNLPLNTAANKVLASGTQQKTRLGGMINKLNSNMNPYINARVRPLEQALGERVATQGREFARRGVFGSLSENEINKTRFLGEREIGDARAMATDDALGQLLNTEAAFRGVNQDEITVAETLMRDELARLGLSLDGLQIALGDQRPLTQVAGGTSNTTTRPASDPMGDIGTMMMMASMMGSDRRIKRDIEPTGNKVAGIPVYRYRYLWDDEVYTGFMADEVEKVMPEAVAYIRGIAHVNYSMILEAA